MNNQDKQTLSIIFAGHFAIDNIIRFKHLNKPTLGGSVTYSSLALKTYKKDIKIRILSHIGNSNFDLKMLDPLRNHNIDLQGVKFSEVENTNFILEYFDHTRVLTLRSKSPNLEIKDIPLEYLENPSDVIVLVPLCNEISYEYTKQILTKFPNSYVGIDLQGFIRKIDQNGKVSYIYDDEIISNLTKIINLIKDKLILKGSEEEIKLFTNYKTDLYDTMNHFKNYDSNGIYIMTLGDKGSLIYKKGKSMLEIPAFRPKKIRDETGAGDVYFSIFLYEFLQSDKSWNAIKKAAYLASAAASFLVEKKGPSGCVAKKKVLNRIKKKDYIK